MKREGCRNKGNHERGIEENQGRVLHQKCKNAAEGRGVPTKKVPTEIKSNGKEEKAQGREEGPVKGRQLGREWRLKSRSTNNHIGRREDKGRGLHKIRQEGTLQRKDVIWWGKKKSTKGRTGGEKEAVEHRFNPQ